MACEIKHKYSGNILFSCETESLKKCVEEAVRNYIPLLNADLHDADLRGAYLVGDFGYANFGGADLRGAYLGRANLSGCNFGGSDLRGAYLGEAWMEDTNLSGAKLDGAELGEAGKLIGDRPIMQISPIGSRSDFLVAYITDKGIFLKTGCFFGTIENFKLATQKTHGENEYAEEYSAALSLIEVHKKIYMQKK